MFAILTARGHTHELLPRIQLLCDEGLAGLAEDPLFYKLVAVGIVSDLQARRHPIDILDQMVVEKWRPALD